MRGRLLVLLIFISSLSFSFSCSGGGTSTSFKVIPTYKKYSQLAVPLYEDFDFVIKNGSVDIIKVSQFKFTGDNPGEFFISANGSVPKTIYGKSEETITIRFRPTSEGLKKAVLEIVHDIYNKDPLTIKLQGSATTEPVIEVNPISADFGLLWIQGKVKKEFTIKSIGTEQLSISAMSFSGSNAADFKILSTHAYPIDMPPNGTIKVEVEWTSAAPASTKNASLNIYHNAAGGSTAISLTAESKPYDPLSVTSISMPNGKVWTDYNAQLTYDGGNGNEKWSVKSGNFPAGLDIHPTTGAVTGKPAYPGTYDYVLQIDDGISNADKQFHISVDKDGSWQDVTPNGFSVNPRAAVANDEFDLYYFGGLSGTNGTTAIKIFDTKHGTFSSATTNLQNARERAVAACIGKYIYIFGGRSNNSTSAQTIQQVERYDTENKTISSDSYMPDGGQYNTCAGVHDGKVYIIGGANPNAAKVYEFTPGTGTNGGTWATKASLTYGGAGFGFVSYNSKMYFIGGYFYGFLHEIYEYDPTLGQGATAVGNTINATGKMQYGFITESLYMVDNGDNLQKYNFFAFTGHSAAYPNCPLVTQEIGSSQNVECMGRIYVTQADVTPAVPLTQVYAYCP